MSNTKHYMSKYNRNLFFDCSKLHFRAWIMRFHKILVQSHNRSLPRSFSFNCMCLDREPCMLCLLIDVYGMKKKQQQLLPILVHVRNVSQNKIKIRRILVHTVTYKSKKQRRKHFSLNSTNLFLSRRFIWHLVIQPGKTTHEISRIKKLLTERNGPR